MPASAEAGTVGPNAVIQLIAALRAAERDQLCAQVFEAAELTQWLASPPAAMVPQEPVGRLHRAVRAAGPAAETNALLAAAGRLTADYLLAHRIPRPVQLLMKPLPMSLRAGLLVSAIRAHAWTFAGTARFTAHSGSPVVFELTGNPFCAGEHAASPVCAWHAAVFERLFQALVSPRSTVTETCCEASGDHCCRFVTHWRGASERVGGDRVSHSAAPAMGYPDSRPRLRKTVT